MNIKGDTMNINQNVLTLALLIGTAFSVFIAGFADFTYQCDDIQDDVLRLHILANSDSEADQAMKLALRDYIIGDLAYIFADCGSAGEAADKARSNLALITEKANEFLRTSGADYTAEAAVTKMYFTTRVYDSVTMPAGEYNALRLTLGKAAGKNWWCVLFPPLCLSFASEKPVFVAQKSIPAGINNIESVSSDGADEDKGGIKIKFAIYEWLRGLFA
jgi:stage II sporulation protein R